MNTTYKYARRRLGLTHEALGAILGIDKRSSIRYEKGHAAVPLSIVIVLEFLTAHARDLASVQRRILKAE